MSIRPIIRYPSILLLAVLSFGSVTKAEQTATAQRCGVDQQQKPRHIFADADGKNWREYPSIDVLPDLTPDVGASIVLQWVASDGKALFSFENPEQDFYIYTDYCFNSIGQLVQLRYELRTAWGWGYRAEGAVLNGVFKPTISEFFSMSDGIRTEKPDGAADLPWATKPKLYTRQSLLPFSKLLPK